MSLSVNAARHKNDQNGCEDQVSLMAFIFAFKSQKAIAFRHSVVILADPSFFYSNGESF
jgi:hypothetical protein